MPKKAQNLINQYQERRNPNLNLRRYSQRPLSEQISVDSPMTIAMFSGLLSNAAKNPDIPSEIRLMIEDQSDALNTVQDAMTSDNPDLNKMEGALEKLGGLGDLLASTYGGNGRTVYDELMTPDGVTQRQLDSMINTVSSDLLLGIDTQRLHDHQPMVHEVWENEAISTGWNLTALNTLQTFVPNNADADDYSDFIDNDENFPRNLNQADYGVNGIDTSNQSAVQFKGQYVADFAAGRHKLASQEKVAEGLDVQRSMSRTFSKEQDRRSDERTKRYYGDLAYVTNPDNGNYMEAVFRTPYVTALMNMHRTMINPVVEGSAQQKMDLGVPLYEASYDLVHAAAEEVRVQYNRQRLEKQPGGWTQEKENEYLSDLKAAHEQTIRNFDVFAQFKERPDGSVMQQFGENRLNATAANNLDDERRYKDVTIGLLRGETKAIDNGWASDELTVLGMIGAIDANLRVYGKFGKQQQAEEVSAFRDDLEKLKKECFYTKVTTADSKRQIADQVKQFMNSHQQTNLQREIMSPVKDMMAGFDKEHSKITAAAARELQAGINPGALKGADPAAYLRDLEQKAVRSGNFSVYAAEVADVFAGKDRLPQDQQQALDQYWNTIQAKAETDHDFIRNFADAMAQNQVKAGAALEQAKQEMAGAIRDGREQVDPLLSDVRHIPEAARLIAGQKLENSEMARQFGNAKNMTERMKGLFVGNPLANYDRYVENAEKVYANDPTDGLSIQEKVMYLELSKEEPGQGLEKYGVQQVKDPNTGAYTVTQAPTKQQVLDELNRISDAIGNGKEDQNISDYRNNLKDLQSMNHGTGDLLNRLERLQANRPTGKYVNGQFVDAETNQPLKRSDANSGAFMNMVEALKEVNALSVADNTPLQVTQALEKLDEAAEAYQQKIASQGIFGAWTSKGQQRLEMAGELREFVRQQRDKFDVYSNSEHLAPNEKIGSQAAKISVAIYDLNVAIQAEQNQARQNQANNAQPVNQNVANNAQPVNQNNAQQHAAPEQKRPGVREFATLDDFMQSLNTKQRPQLEEPAAKEQQRQRSSSIHQRQTGNQKQEMNQQPMQPGNI